MTQRSFKSFEELGRRERDKRLRAATGKVPVAAGGTGGARLRVSAELAANAGPAQVHECRAVVLDWLQETMGTRLPRKAWRHRPFSRTGDNASCRAVRVRDARRDHWAVRVERTQGAGREVATEISVLCPEGGAPSVDVLVLDRSVVPVETANDYPAAMLAAMAERVPLLQGGRRLTHRPVIADSDATMNAFLKMLVDPGRDMPFAVVSVAPEDGHDDAIATQWDALARSLTGLAVTWVLPSQMTYRLSDTVGKPLSVFLGAWRFYRRGFDPGANRSHHPLILKNRMPNERAVGEVVQSFLRMAAEERRRADTGASQRPGYDAIAQEAAGVARGPARFVSFLRNSILGGSTASPPPSPPGYSASGAGAGMAPAAPDAGPVPSDAAQQAGMAPPAAGSAPAPAVVREPPPPGAVAAQVAGRIARPAAAGQETPLLRRKLRAARETARVRASRYERARERADRLQRERDDAVKRADQLAGLVRSMGGNPDATVPFPTAWGEFAVWCDEAHAGRVVLTPSARRELDRAEFRDVGLAARCLGWLAGRYRNGRLKGGSPQLHGRIDDIDEGVFNVPCGGDTFEHTWEGRNHNVNWHIKGGANTRDPRRCLRIYYFWDERTRQVVVASMPAHRRTAMS